MSHKKKRRILIRIGICLIAVGLLAGVSAMQGAARERTDLPQHYPDEFSGQGQIDRIATDEIVINDTWYRLSPYAIFNTPNGVNVSRSSFHEGQSVYFILNGENKIKSVWLIK
jgi:hypothetical protein